MIELDLRLEKLEHLAKNNTDMDLGLSTKKNFLD